jgi:hypothetical protein
MLISSQDTKISLVADSRDWSTTEFNAGLLTKAKAVKAEDPEDQEDELLEDRFSE